nr:MAG TPA: hypothetical protein [Caudoviricetes sp.]
MILLFSPQPCYIKLYCVQFCCVLFNDMRLYCIVLNRVFY